jgi:hypothetical protein
MKLNDYITKHHSGNISSFARSQGYHLTQVKRCIAQGGFIDEDGKPYFKKYLNKKEQSNDKRL